MEGYVERTDEGRYLYLEKLLPDFSSTCTTTSPTGTNITICPEIVGGPVMWYAIDPFAFHALSTFPEWVNSFDEVFIDPETNHVWLKLLVDDSDPRNLVARWQEEIESTIVRNGVTGTLSISVDIEFWRGETSED